jgi:hypothetical protein
MVIRRGSYALMWAFVVASLATAGCPKRDADDESGQIAAAVGEVMASLDESVAGSSATAMLPLNPMRRMPAELRGPLWRRAFDSVVPSAYAATCGGALFSPCTDGVRTMDFDACTIGAATLDGTVTLTFTRTAACALLTDGDAVTRTADFTLTGPYGGTLTVSSPGGGQTVTRTAAGFDYTVGGMQRVLRTLAGRAVFDVSTRTTAPIVVTGSARTDLVLVSGSLEISHNIADYQVTLTAQNLRWTPTCNCASSGTLTGSVVGGRFDGKSASVTITACGEADITLGDETESVTLDRCAPQ